MKLNEEQLNEITEMYRDMDVDPSSIAPEIYITNEGLVFTASVESFPGITATTTYTISKNIPREVFENVPLVRGILGDITYEEFMKTVHGDYEPDQVKNKPYLHLVKDGE